VVLLTRVGLQSVFAILDCLRRPSAYGTEAPAGAVPSSTPGEESDDDVREGDGSVMLYAPLVPGEDSEVELAASDITSVFDDGETLEYEQPARPLSFVQAGERHTSRSPSRTLPPESRAGPLKTRGPPAPPNLTHEKNPAALGGSTCMLKEKMVEGGNSFRTKLPRVQSH
jgi:hypothetical protein